MTTRHDTYHPGYEDPEPGEHQDQGPSGTTTDAEAEDRGSIVARLVRPGTEHDAAHEETERLAGAAGPLGRAYLAGVITRLGDPGHPASLARQEPELEAGS